MKKFVSALTLHAPQTKAGFPGNYDELSEALSGVVERWDVPPVSTSDLYVVNGEDQSRPERDVLRRNKSEQTGRVTAVAILQQESRERKLITPRAGIVKIDINCFVYVSFVRKAKDRPITSS